MSRNGSGTYTLPLAAVVTGTVISSTWANTTLDDIATALTGSLAKNGETVVTGSLDFNGNKIILDADADTSITADTDDQIDIEISGSDVIVLKTGGQTLIGTTTAATGSPKLDILDADAENIVISNFITDATNKQGYLSIRHRTNSEEPATIIGGNTNSTDNVVRIGGGLATNNAATIHSFYTAATNTTTTGTERMRLTNSAVTLIGDMKLGDATTISDTPSAPLHVADSASGTMVLYECTDAGSTSFDVVCYRNSASPANSDAISRLIFRGKDSGGNDTNYAQIGSTITDVTNGSEDGTIFFNTMVAGTAANRLQLGAGLYTNNATGGDKGADSINASTMYLNGEQFGAAWTTPTYSGSDFTGGNSQTWTVDSGDITTYAYTITGKTMTVAFTINSTTVGGTPDTLLNIAIPASKVATKTMRGMYIVNVAGVYTAAKCFVVAGGTTIRLVNDVTGATNWAASTNGTGVEGVFTFEIN